LTRSNPTVARIRLAALFREARERSGRSLDDLSKFLNISAPQASRLDSGTRGFRPRDAQRLAEWYGLGDADTAGLVALAEESRRREWWQQVDLHDAYRTYIGMEQQAQSIAEYSISVVPGLLQTAEYARVVASVAAEAGIDPDARPERIERAVGVRLRRQEILDRRPPPMLTVVIDEAVLARGPRDDTIRRGQLAHLRAAADWPNVVIQVIGFEYGLYRGPGSGYILLDMEPGLPGLFFADELRGPQASSDEAELARNRREWGELRARALDEFRSRDRIDRYLQ
jgi:transcriptional regulator with XRE-family HTH domain